MHLTSAHLRLPELRPDLGAALGADEFRLDVGQADMVRPEVGTEFDLMAAAVVGAIDQHLVHVHLAEFGEGDLLRVGRHGSATGSPGGGREASRYRLRLMARGAQWRRRRFSNFRLPLIVSGNDQFGEGMGLSKLFAGLVVREIDTGAGIAFALQCADLYDQCFGLGPKVVSSGEPRERELQLLTLILAERERCRRLLELRAG